MLKIPSNDVWKTKSWILVHPQRNEPKEKQKHKEIRFLNPKKEVNMCGEVHK